MCCDPAAQHQAPAPTPRRLWGWREGGKGGRGGGVGATPLVPPPSPYLPDLHPHPHPSHQQNQSLCDTVQTMRWSPCISGRCTTNNDRPAGAERWTRQIQTPKKNKKKKNSSLAVITIGIVNGRNQIKLQAMVINFTHLQSSKTTFEKLEASSCCQGQC